MPWHCVLDIPYRSQRDTQILGKIMIIPGMSVVSLSCQVPFAILKELPLIHSN